MTLGIKISTQILRDTMELNITEHRQALIHEVPHTGLDWLREAGQLLYLLWVALLELLHRAQRTHPAPLALNVL